MQEKDIQEQIHNSHINQKIIDVIKLYQGDDDTLNEDDLLLKLSLLNYIFDNEQEYHERVSGQGYSLSQRCHW